MIDRRRTGPTGLWVGDRIEVSGMPGLVTAITLSIAEADEPELDVRAGDQVATVEVRQRPVNAIAGEVRLDDAIRPQRGVR